MLVGEPAANAETSNLPLAEQQHRSWTARDGLPPRILAVAQTADGFVWLGTYKGIFRFDGVSFVPGVDLGMPPSSKLPVTFLNASGDRLDIGFVGGGGATWDRANWSAFGLADGVFQVDGIVRRTDGTVWLDAQLSLMILVDGHPQAGAVDKTCSTFDPDGLVADASGGLWAIGERQTQTLMHMPMGDNTCHLETLPFHSRSLVVAGDLLWLGTDEGVWVANWKGDGSKRVWKHLSTAPVQNILQTKNGDLYVGAEASLTRYPKARDWAIAGGRTPEPDQIDSSHGFSGTSVFSLFEDQQGSLWIGSAGTLERFRDSRFVAARMPGRSSTNYNMSALPDGALLAGDFVDTGLVRIDGDNVKKLEDASQVRALNQVYTDGAGMSWIASSEALYRWRVGQPLSEVAALKNVFGGTRSIFGDSTGSLWIDGLPGGSVTRLRPDGEVERPPRIPGFPERWEFRGGTEDPSGRIWFGTADGVRVIEKGVGRTLQQKTHGLTFGKISNFYARGAHLWAGGNLGAGLLDGDTFRALVDVSGKPMGAVTGIVETKGGDLWLNSEEGTFYVSSAELQAALPHLSHAVRIRRFDSTDGRVGIAQFSLSTPTLVADGKDRLWITTDAGIARVETGDMAVPETPKVCIDAIVTDSKTYRPDGRVLLPALTDRIKINYAAPELARPEKIRFRYRLEGLDRDWRDAEAARSVTYSNVAPGSYVFHVVSTNVDGEWSSSEATMEFSVAPAWYQTVWLKIACACALLCAFWLMHRARTILLSARLRAQQAVELRERGRIARELHDTLLQGVQGLNMVVGAVMHELTPASAARTRLERALVLSEQTLRASRDRVSELRTPDGEDSLDTILEELALNSGSEGLTFQPRVIGEVQPLRPEVATELSRVLHEALRNVVQHSEADAVRLEVQFSRAVISLTFADNGRGVADASVLLDKPRHWGLRGMRERIDRLGGKLRVQSYPGGGFEVTIELNARLACT